jgi:GcrA cell cycle regulator
MAENRNGHDNHALAWTIDRIEKLKTLWHKRLSASLIGSILGVSRSAVLGKVHRLGNLETRKTLRVPPVKQPIVRTQHIRGRRKPQPPQPLPPEPIVEVEFLDFDLDQLGRGDCHYPHGEQVPYSFCGQPVQQGSSFCPVHHRISYHAATPARRYYGAGLAVWRGAR